ncbi:hypothetical protein [Sphaerisporangium corydalis]|uniref:Uncharacterized protein n=1 Tax=Sphaerisporangium corydalis TaxID=1441875 RepID=A0ABV9EI46_9ACTN|nr:hypothetical protein [Sphaerisporangium corydalis]
MTKASLFDWDVYTGHEPAGWTACGVTASEKSAVERVRTTFAAIPHGTCAWAEITRVRLDPAHLSPRERLPEGRRVAVRLWDGGVVWSLPRWCLTALRRPAPRRRPVTPELLDGYRAAADPAGAPYPFGGPVPDDS